MIKFAARFAGQIGLAPRQLLRVRHLPRFLKQLLEFSKLGSDLPIRAIYPILSDYTEAAGTARGHYFHMDLWAARKIFLKNPGRHLDIGSRLDGFVAHLLSFRAVEVIDIRPLSSSLEGLTFVQDDATELRSFPDESVASISCLHAAEHFGLGRYGDPLDPNGPKKLASAIERVLARGGRLYFAVPIGRERVEFNAHRIYNPETVLRYFPGLTLESFAAVNDQGDLDSNCAMSDYIASEFSCGLFEFRKPL